MIFSTSPRLAILLAFSNHELILVESHTRLSKNLESAQVCTSMVTLSLLDDIIPFACREDEAKDTSNRPSVHTFMRFRHPNQKAKGS